MHQFSSSSSIGVIVHDCRQAGHPSLATAEGMVHCWKGTYFLTHFCTKMKISAAFDFMGDLDKKGPSCELLLSQHLNRPESHQRSHYHFKAFVWKFSFFAKAGKRICSFNSPQIIANVNYLISLNLTYRQVVKVIASSVGQ